VGVVKQIIDLQQSELAAQKILLPIARVTTIVNCAIIEKTS